MVIRTQEVARMTKKQLKEFRVEKSHRIDAYCVTNDEYSVVLIE